MSGTVMPPTDAVVDAVTLIDEAVGRFLAARRSLPKLGKYESDNEVRNMFTLALRHVEAICELARRDLVLLPSALVLARAASETTGKIRWILLPDEVFEREAHFLAHLAKEEEYCAKTAKLLDELGHDGELWKTKSLDIHQFRQGVEQLLPPNVTPPKSVPDFRAILKACGQEMQYASYMRLSQFTHGTHVAGGLYRKNLGGGKVFGEFISPASWAEPLRCAWWCLATGGMTILRKLNGNPSDFLDDQFVQKVTQALERVEQ